MDPYKVLNISVNPDGTLTRHATVPTSPPTATTKDVPLNPSHNTSIRLFIPSTTTTAAAKLPVILYFHGGGFVLFTAASSIFHDSCATLSSALPALVLSVDYRLAPEHRLPAAYDDALDALLWLRNCALNPDSSDPWILSHADFSRCFLMGSSSGANIAYRLALRSLDLPDLAPVKIRGLILNQAFFGGEEATESELRMENDRIVPLAASRLLWELALPVGADRDHEYCNPMRVERAKVKRLPRCLVRGYVGDPLIDRQRAFAARLEREGVRVVASLEEEGFHGIEVFDLKKAEELVADIKSFVYADSDGDDDEIVGRHRL